MPHWRADDVPGEAPEPLPRHWLPEPTSREGTAEWEISVTRVLAEAELRVSVFELHPALPWTSVLGSWWRGAAALAAAAAALLLLVPGEPVQEAAAGALPLSVVATEGDPAALLAGLGVEADPVLAWIALEGGAP